MNGGRMVTITNGGAPEPRNMLKANARCVSEALAHWAMEITIHELKLHLTVASAIISGLSLTRKST
jgi:hypothetical protein